MHVKEMMVTTCEIVTKDPNNKKELIEKMQRIEDVDECKTKEVEQVMETEEFNETSTKRKVTQAKEDKIKYFDPQDSPHAIGTSDNRNQHVQWVKNTKENNIKIAKINKAQKLSQNE